MRNLPLYLMMAVAIVVIAPAVMPGSRPGEAGSSPVTAGHAGLPARRSRFLANSPPIYDCSKKSATACLAPGAMCCGGQCVDTVSSSDHCGGCHKVCKHGRTCCGGRCVDLSSDKHNCGRCSNRCNNKCSHGFCDYA